MVQVILCLKEWFGQGVPKIPPTNDNRTGKCGCRDKYWQPELFAQLNGKKSRQNLGRCTLHSDLDKNGYSKNTWGGVKKKSRLECGENNLGWCWGSSAWVLGMSPKKSDYCSSHRVRRYWKNFATKKMPVNMFSECTRANLAIRTWHIIQIGKFGKEKKQR